MILLLLVNAARWLDVTVDILEHLTHDRQAMGKVADVGLTLHFAAREIIKLREENADLKKKLKNG